MHKINAKCTTHPIYAGGFLRVALIERFPRTDADFLTIAGIRIFIAGAVNEFKRVCCWEQHTLYAFNCTRAMRNELLRSRHCIALDKNR